MIFPSNAETRYFVDEFKKSPYQIDEQTQSLREMIEKSPNEILLYMIELMARDISEVEYPAIEGDIEGSRIAMLKVMQEYFEAAMIIEPLQNKGQQN